MCTYILQALIIGNTSSEVMVPSLQSMVNLLGPSPEPGFSVTAAHHRQFLMLEASIVACSYIGLVNKKYCM